MSDKKELILDAALRLFAAQGLDVPTAQIAREAGVANGTLFNYFPTKQELIDQLYVQIKTEIGDCFRGVSLESEPREIFLAIWSGYVRWAVANPVKQKVAHLLKAGGMVSAAVVERMEAGFQGLEGVLRRGVSEGTLQKLEPTYFRAILEALIAVCIEQALLRKLRAKTLDLHIQTGFEIFWKGVT